MINTVIRMGNLGLHLFIHLLTRILLTEYIPGCM